MKRCKREKGLEDHPQNRGGEGVVGWNMGSVKQRQAMRDQAGAAAREYEWKETAREEQGNKVERSKKGKQEKKTTEVSRAKERKRRANGEK